MTTEQKPSVDELAKRYSMNCDETMGLEEHCEDAFKAGHASRDAEIAELKEQYVVLKKAYDLRKRGVPDEV